MELHIRRRLDRVDLLGQIKSFASDIASVQNNWAAACATQLMTIQPPKELALLWKATSVGIRTKCCRTKAKLDTSSFYKHKLDSPNSQYCLTFLMERNIFYFVAITVKLFLNNHLIKIKDAGERKAKTYGNTDSSAHWVTKQSLKLSKILPQNINRPKSIY